MPSALLPQQEGMDEQRHFRTNCAPIRKTDYQKAFLTVDNASSHNKINRQGNLLQIMYLPENTTSRLQPADLGCIRSLMAGFRRLSFKLPFKQPKDITLYDSLHLLKTAWEFDVTENCWRNSRIYECGLKGVP